MTGSPDRPHRAMVPWVDFSTALHCAFGTLVALMARRQTGKGQVVEGALLATAVTLTNAMLIEQAVIKADRVPTGNRGQTSAPADIFRTRDGWIIAQVIGQPLYRRWVKLMGEPEWLADPRFKDDISRGNNSEVISARMSRWCAERTTAEVLEILGQGQNPGGPGLSAAADARRSAHPCHGFLPADGISRHAEARADREGAGMAIGNARRDTPPGADAWRAYRSDHGDTRLRRGRYRGTAKKGRHIGSALGPFSTEMVKARARPRPLQLR